MNERRDEGPGSVGKAGPNYAICVQGINDQGL
jgi:hypothetical protein